MATYVISGTSPLLVRVDYVDAAGGYGGWFVLNVPGDNLLVDSDGNPANGLDGFNKLNAVLEFAAGITTGYAGRAATGTGFTTGGYPEYRQRLLDAVRDRLAGMFGVGSSATWTATLLESVTPAVIDDSF